MKNEEVTTTMTAEQAYQFAKDIIKGPFPEGEHVIAKVPEVAIYYAHAFVKGRWPECEQAMLEQANPKTIWYYIEYVMKEPWPEAEEILATTMEKPHWAGHEGSFAYHYAYQILKQRWPEGENRIRKSVDSTIAYAKNVIKGRWPEAESFLLSVGPWSVFDYIKALMPRYELGDWPEAEEVILTSPLVTAHFSLRIINNWWFYNCWECVCSTPISNDTNWWCCERCSTVLKFERSHEEVIITDAVAAASYAKRLGRRWPEAEPIILTDPKAASKYACHVLRGEWPEFEATFDQYEQEIRHWDCPPLWYLNYYQVANGCEW